MSAASNSVPRLLREKLPPVELRDLPKPRSLALLVGPGVIMLATSLGSGEIYFWPGLTMKYGFLLLWPALIAFGLQYVLNTEFARYTVATGETVITGFARLWRPLAWVFLACSTLPWLWPGWSTGGATALSWVFGGRPEVISAVSLLAIGVGLSGTRVVYRTVERVQMVLAACIFVAIGFIALLVVRLPTFQAFGQGLASVPTALPADLDIATLLAALAFCGAGGSINLATSHWVRDKGFGMGNRVPKVTSPLTGEVISVASGGFFFEPSSKNLERWAAWWRLMRREQLITFLGLGSIALITLMLIAHALLFGRDLDIGMEMLRVEGTVVPGGERGLVSTVFYLAVAAIFFTSALGVLDHVARLAADIFKTNAARIRRSNSRYLSESALYFYVLWAMIAFAISVLFVANIRDTPTLLEIAGSLSGIVMFLYSGLTILLMRRLAADVEKADRRFIGHNPFRLPLWRLTALVVAVLFYGGFSTLLVVNTVRRFLGS